MALQGEPGRPALSSQLLPGLERLPGWVRITLWSVWGAFTALFIAGLFILPPTLLLGLINLPDFLPIEATTDRPSPTPNPRPPTNEAATTSPLLTPEAVAEATANLQPPTPTASLTSSPLASSPSPSSSPTPTPTDTSTSTGTPIPLTSTPTLAPTATSTFTPTPEPTPTATATPTSTSTPLPLTSTATPTRIPTSSTSTPTLTPTIVRPVSTRIVAPAAAPDLPGGVLTLIAPLSIGEPPTRGSINFIWEWVGDTLAPKYGFEVRVWLNGEPPTGVHDAVLDNQEGRIEPIGLNRYRLKISDIRYAKGVLGREGNYSWTVLVVQISPTYTDFGLQAIPARFRYEPFQNRKGPR